MTEMNASTQGMGDRELQNLGEVASLDSMGATVTNNRFRVRSELRQLQQLCPQNVATRAALQRQDQENEAEIARVAESREATALAFNRDVQAMSEEIEAVRNKLINLLGGIFGPKWRMPSVSGNGS